MRYTSLKKSCTFAVILIITGVTLVPIVCSNISTNDFKIQNGNETEYYAVIAACTKYEHKKHNIPKIPFPPISERKLKCLYDSLLQSENWNENNIILLLNEQATSQNIINALDNMSKKVDQNDVFLFSWQGHGSEVPENLERGPIDEEDGKDEVICPYECYRTEEGVLLNYITDDELDEQFSKINASGMYLIFECCLSGGLVNSSNNNTITNKELYTSNFIEELTNPRLGTLDVNKGNRVVIMSTSPGYLGKASFLLGFPLTYSIAQAFKRKTADKNKDGFISGEEAFLFAKPRAIVQSQFFWISAWGINCLLYDSLPYDYPILKSTLEFIISYLLVQWYVHKNTDHYMMNTPNMKDNYEGELLLVKK